MVKMMGHQIAFTLRRNMAAAAFYILLAIVLINFGKNVIIFEGKDIVEMYHITRLLSLSDDCNSEDIKVLLVQLYPVLVTCPAGFILISEKNRKSDSLIISRIGSTRYYIGKVIAAFFATMIVFTVPFFIELGLNCFSFPLKAEGSFVILNRYGYNMEYYSELMSNYLLRPLFDVNLYAYTIAGILIFGAFSGVLGMLTVAISAIFNFRYKIFLFLPVYILLNLPLYLTEFTEKLPFTLNLRWSSYVFLYDDSAKNKIGFFAVMLSLFAFSIVCALVKGRRDQI